MCTSMKFSISVSVTPILTLCMTDLEQNFAIKCGSTHYTSQQHLHLYISSKIEQFIYKGDHELLYV